MRRSSTIQEERWSLTAEATWDHPSQGRDIVALRSENDQLRRMMAGRAAVDQACGMVMALMPCGRGVARGLLVDVSRQCDVKLREVAAALVATSEGDPFPEQMHRAIRHSLLRIYAADRR
ncbi:ANTAR domain-containing protein [Streptomyces sp. NPDC006475]|uniref:ANTAR domain-containing protein n=1 Tax=Streptomyces achmelvichensis TaxID=3134111 RepID=A0ACC6PZ20_9ACTN|nr:ANTAR domain-containing protein [Streptomyces sp. NBC_01167]